jgi:hypothetical protein
MSRIENFFGKSDEIFFSSDLVWPGWHMLALNFFVHVTFILKPSMVITLILVKYVQLKKMNSVFRFFFLY